jgi:hypothetical protein
VVDGGDGNDFCLDVEDGVHGNDTVIGGPGFDRAQADTGDARIGVEAVTPCIPE